MGKMLNSEKETATFYKTVAFLCAFSLRPPWLIHSAFLCVPFTLRTLRFIREHCVPVVFSVTSFSGHEGYKEDPSERLPDLSHSGGNSFGQGTFGRVCGSCPERTRRILCTSKESKASRYLIIVTGLYAE
jgi:hypothetical protein